MGKEWFIIYRGGRWIGRRPCRWLPRGNVTFSVLTRDYRFVMAAKPFKGICRVACRTRTTGASGPADTLVRRWEYPSMKKVKREDRAAVKHLVPMETEVFCDLLPLVEHCGMLQYEDGEARVPGWFTVRTNGAAWQCTVKDPDSASSFTTTAKTLDEALTTAALLLGCEEAPWEPDPWLAGAKARKKTK